MNSVTELRPILDALPDIVGHETKAPMLPRECYTSPAFFAWERETIFARNWVCVGREDQIAVAGERLAVSVAGESLIVARTPTGAIRAMSAVCQHRGHVIPCTQTASAGGELAALSAALLDL